MNIITDAQNKIQAPTFVEKLVNALDGVLLDIDKSENDLSVGLSDNSVIDLFIRQLDNFAKPIFNEIQGIAESFDKRLNNNALIINSNSFDLNEISDVLSIADTPEYIQGSVFAYFNSLTEESVAKYSGGMTMAVYSAPVTNTTQIAITPGKSSLVASDYRKNIKSFTSFSLRSDPFSPIQSIVSNYSNGKISGGIFSHMNNKATPLLVPTPSFNSWMVFKDINSAKIEMEALLKNSLQKERFMSYAPGGNVYQQYKAEQEYRKEFSNIGS